LEEIKVVEDDKSVGKKSKKSKNANVKANYFDEVKDNEILQEYEDETKNIMDIGTICDVKPWQVISVLVRHGKINKRTESRGYDIYKETEEYKNKLEK
jgi:hypothetical protein